MEPTPDDGAVWLAVADLDLLPDGTDVCSAQLRPWVKEDGMWDGKTSAELVERCGDMMLHPIILTSHDLTRSFLRKLLDHMGAGRPLRVEVYRQLRPGASKFEPPTDESFEYRWRVVHASNGETMCSGEGYADKRDRDHAVQLLFPGVEVVEVDR